MKLLRTVFVLALACACFADVHANLDSPSSEPEVRPSDIGRRARIRLEAPDTASCGRPVRLAAIVEPGRRQGTVEFRDGDRLLGSAPLDHGVARFVTRDLRVGRHVLTAVLGRNHENPRNVSPPVTLHVLPDCDAPPPPGTVVVPDDFPTIQQALDAAPPSVLVRSGVYAERPIIRQDVVLRGHPDNLTPPETNGLLVFLEMEQEAIVVEDLNFHGPVRLQTLDEVTELVAFRRCRIDSGLVHHASDVLDIEAFVMHHCVVHGGLGVAVYSLDLQHNEIEGAVGFGSSSSEGPAVVRNNRFTGGPGAYGVVLGDFGNLDFSTNVVRGYAIGAHLARGEVRAIGNRFESCSNTGLAITAERARVENNQLERCGYGISVDVFSQADVIGNRVIGSTYEGLMVRSEDLANVQSNVVGRSGRAGIVINMASGGLRVANNTSYLNQGSGFEVGGTMSDADSVFVRNIGYRNARYGLEGAIEGAGPLACNDWFGNTLGAVHESTPGPSDLDVDPLFCAVDADNVHLTARSPLAGTSGCGLVGALGVGCKARSREAAIAHEAPASPARYAIEAIAPNPSKGPARIRFAAPQASRVQIVVLDLQGREIARLADGVVEAGQHEIRWDAHRNGAPAPAGVYFVRYRHPEGQQVMRLLMTR